MTTKQTTPEQDNGVIEGTATEMVPAPQAPAPSLFHTDDPVEVVAKATAVADALADVIDKKHLFKNIGDKSHVLVEGWQLLGSMLGVTAVCVKTEPVDGGYKATVEARTADGRVVGRADALCTKQEKRGPWKSADDYARLSMAQTRATSKALKGPLGFIVSLAGYATTPAEEMTFAEGDSDTEPTQVEQSVTITRKRAEELVTRAIDVGIPSQQLGMQLVTLDVDLADGIDTKGKAIAAVRSLSPEGADQLNQWISECAEKIAAREQA